MKFTLLFFLLSFTCSVYGQADTKFSSFYYHKKDFFESMPNDTNEIVFLGNSITDFCEWSEMFRDLRIKNRGISGDITEGVLYRLQEVTDSKPLKVFIMIGINDLSKNIPNTQILFNYEDIIKSIKRASPKTKIYVQSVLPVNDKFKEYPHHVNKTNAIIELNSDLQKLAQIHRVEYIDLYSVFKDASNRLDEKYTLDGLHLNGAGYLLWKKTIEPLVH